MSQWDWPNQQIVRADHSGPGMNTPSGIASDITITYGHSGLGYEFLLKTFEGAPITSLKTVDWDFGDGNTAKGVSPTIPATHTYEDAGTYTASAVNEGRYRTVTIEASE